MSYKFTKSISDETYNQLISASTLEDLQNIKTTFSSILEKENNENISNITLFSIRTLQLNEYTKYIKNETLNGSITASNINVWHFQNKKYNYHDRICENFTYQNFDVAPAYIYMEISSNNSLQKNSVFHYNGYYSVELYHSRSGASSFFTYTQNETYNKTDSLISFGSTYSSAWSSSKILFIRFSFRPVFQYVDNSKSTTINY